MRSRKGWYINKNRTLEIWTKDSKVYDIFVSPEKEFGMMFIHNNHVDFLGDVLLTDLIKYGYKKVDN